MIELAEYGQLIMKEEFTLDSKNNKLISGLYLGNDEIFGEDVICLDMALTKNNDYHINLMNAKTGEEKEYCTEKIKDLKSITTIKDREYPGIHTWKNSRVKNDDTFQYDFGGVKLLIPKDHKVVGDNDILSEYLDDFATVAKFYNHKYGIYCQDLDSKLNYYLLSNENTSIDGISQVFLDKVEHKEIDVPNLSFLAKNITYYDASNEPINTIQLSYDNDGIQKGGDYCLYESYTIEGYENPVFIASLHPFYYDTFDTGIVNTGYKYFCIDQINRYLDNDIQEYTREVYRIADKYINELLKKIQEAKDKHEHAIPTI